MAEYSGVAAVLPQPGPPHEPPIGEGVMNMMEKIVAIKQAKQTMAQSKLDSMMKMAQAGFPVNEKEWAKVVKASGIPISTKPEDMMADIAVDRQAKKGTMPTSEVSEGAGIAGVAASSKKIADQQQQPQPLDKNATPEQKHEFFLNTIAKQARQRMAATAATDQQKAENELRVENLKAAAMGTGAGADEAMGKLISLGLGHFDINYATWAKMTDEQKARAANIAAGGESDAAKAERGTRIAESLLTSGRMNDPTKAYQIGNVLAAGGEVSGELKAAIKPYSFQDLAHESELANNLVQLGVPTDMIGKTLHAATVGGLENALPKGLKPLAIEGMKLQQQQVAIEQSKMGLDYARYVQETSRLNRLDDMAKANALKEDDRATVDMFKAALEAKKAGTPFPEDMMNGLKQKVAGLAGMDVDEVDHWYGTTYNYVPHLSDTGKSVVDRAAGEPMKTTTPSIIESIKTAGKKAGIGVLKDMLKVQEHYEGKPKQNTDDGGTI